MSEDFSCVEVGDIPSLQGYISSRETSIVSAKIARLGMNDSFELDMGKGACVAGFVLNMYQTSGSLKIISDEVFIKRLDSNQVDGSKNLCLVSWSMQYPMYSADGSFKFEVVRDCESDSGELNDHCTLNNSHQDVIVELAAIIMKGGMFLGGKVAIEGEELNLSGRQ